LLQGQAIGKACNTAPANHKCLRQYFDPTDTGKNICAQCNTGLYLDKNFQCQTCDNINSTSQFPDKTSGLCQVCNSNCENCDSRFLTSGRKCYSCKPGSFLKDNTCLKCSADCKTCSKFADSCDSCTNSSKFLDFSTKTCVATCEPYQNSDSLDENLSFFIQNPGNTCKRCHRKCLTCKSSASNCTSCNLQYSIKKLVQDPKVPNANKLICLDRYLDLHSTSVSQIIGKFPQKFTPNLWPIIHRQPLHGKDLTKVMFNGWLKLIPTWNVESNAYKMNPGRTTIFRLTKSGINAYSDDFENPKENQILFFLEVEDDDQCTFKIRFTDFEIFIVYLGKSEIS
jgi:hypothetical protein